jgi:hypothetical protein
MTRWLNLFFPGYAGCRLLTDSIPERKGMPSFGLLPVQQLGQFAEGCGGEDGIPAGVTYCGLATWKLPLLGKGMLSFGVCKGF